MMTDNTKKVNLSFWDKAVQAYQSSDIALPEYCAKHGIEQEELSLSGKHY